jgi:hypothetical protein
MTAPNMNNVHDAFEKYNALLSLEKLTGTKTTRARNEVLRGLNDSDLTAIALLIAKGTDPNARNNAR